MLSLLARIFRGMLIGKGVEKVKGGEPNKVKPALKNNSEDKLVSLRDFRRKNGLCFKCGGKWDKNHKCPA